MVVSSSTLPDTCSRMAVSARVQPGEPRWAGGSGSGPHGAPCPRATPAPARSRVLPAPSPWAERGPCPCLHRPSCPGRRGGLGTPNPMLHFASARVRDTDKRSLSRASRSWPTIPTPQPALRQSTREGNPSPALHGRVPAPLSVFASGGRIKQKIRTYSRKALGS